MSFSTKWRHWDNENSHAQQAVPLHSERETLWYVVKVKRIIEPSIRGLDGLLIQYHYFKTNIFVVDFCWKYCRSIPRRLLFSNNSIQKTNQWNTCLILQQNSASGASYWRRSLDPKHDRMVNNLPVVILIRELMVLRLHRLP